MVSWCPLSATCPVQTHGLAALTVPEPAPPRAPHPHHLLPARRLLSWALLGHKGHLCYPPVSFVCFIKTCPIPGSLLSSSLQPTVLQIQFLLPRLFWIPPRLCSLTANVVFAAFAGMTSELTCQALHFSPLLCFYLLYLATGCVSGLLESQLFPRRSLLRTLPHRNLFRINRQTQ